MGNWISKSGRGIESFAGAVATKLGFGPSALIVKLLAPCEGAFKRCTERKHESWEANEHFVKNFRLYSPTTTIWILLYHMSRFRCPSCRAAYCAALIAHPDFHERVVQMIKFVS